MCNIYINGYGIIAPGIKSKDDLIDLIKAGTNQIEDTIERFNDNLLKREFRRMDRFSILSLLSVQAAYNSIENAELEPYRCGTIINTSYGCIETNLDYANDLINGQLSDISPIKFSHTVYNACLGHVCKKFHLKGPSTLTLSSNYFYLAMALLKRKKANWMFVSGIESCADVISNYFSQQGVKITECGTTLALSSCMTSDSIAEIVTFYEVNMGGHPYLEPVEPTSTDISKAMKNALKRAGITPNKIDFIIYSTFSMRNTEIECCSIKEVFAGVEYEEIKVSETMGETLGASLGLNILTAAALLKECNKKDSYSLVNNYDLSGNFITYVLRSI